MARKPGLLMALALLVLAPAGVSSLGLGDIRLNSYLNEPLDAEVTIAVSSPEELETLAVAVASDEAFDRFGLERPRFLSDLVFTVEPGPGAGATLRIRSPEPVVEPFLTFLIEANWAGGRLLREYTVLLDPPLFLPEPAQAPQPQAPVAETPGTGVISRPAAQPAPAPRATVSPPAVVAPATSYGPATYGPVRRNDTLWRIASDVRPDRGVSVNQTMVALFEANPDAFEGNINVLRAGATLRVPSREEIARVGRARATAEVRRQHAEWSPGAAAGAPVPAPTIGAGVAPVTAEGPVEERLELVVPGRTEDAAGPAASEAPAAASAGAEYVAEQEALNREMLSALQSLRDELEETRRLIELKDAEIASLQNRLGEIEAAAPVDAPVDVALEVPVAPPVGAGEDVGEPAAPTTAESAAAPAAQPEDAAPPARPAAVPAPVTRPEDAPGLLSSRWLWMAVALVALLAFALFWRRRQERLAADEETYGTFEPAPRRPVEPVAVATGGAAAAGFLVEEQPAPARARPDKTPAATDEAAREPDRFDAGVDFEEADFTAADDRSAEMPEPASSGAAEYQYPFEDTIAGASGIDLDQSDPLAEADFHMAYGLYDQAADLVGKAVEREPDRIDLRMKLLDILFVWGKEERFLTEARAVREIVGDDTAPEWGRVAIMGRQICPDEPLFAGEGTAGVDVAVEASGPGEAAAGAADSLDFDIGEDETSGADDDLIDFDLGVTGEMPAVRRQGVSPDQTGELEIEDLGLDLDLGDATGEVLAGLAAAADGPGVDIDLEGLGAGDEPAGRDAGDTAEVLGLRSVDAGDTAELTSLGETLAREAREDELTEVVGGMDDPTELAPVADSDDRTARLERAQAAEAGTPPGDSGLTGLTEILEATTKIGDEGATVVAQTVQMPSARQTDEELEDYSSQIEQPDFSTRRLEAVVDQSDVDDDDTAEVEAIEAADPRLDLDDLTAALSADLGRSAGSNDGDDEPDGDDLIGQIFGDQEETRIAPGFDVLTATDAPSPREDKVEAAPPDVTLDEVGTKLDLARAYIDMGDPDGARSILEEVLSEGNDRQRDEAQQLMDGVT